MGLWGKLTGSDKRRAKRRYNSAVSEHNNYEAQAKRNINKMRAGLEENSSHLRSLYEQKQYNDFKARDITSSVNQYQNLLAGFNKHSMEIEQEATGLKSTFDEFAKKAPVLANKISELEKLPELFSNRYETTKSQKAKLSGLNEEEAEGFIKKHKSDVESLKKNRSDTQEYLRLGMQDVTKEHDLLSVERNNLSQKIEGYRQKRDKFLNETTSFNEQRQILENTIKDFKANDDQINNNFNNKKTQVEKEEKDLQNYINNASGHLNHLGGEISFRARKYKKAAKATGLVQGIGLGALTFGLGAGIGALGGKLAAGGFGASTLGSIASGLKYASPLLGTSHYLKTVAPTTGLGEIDKVDLNNNHRSIDLSHLAKYGLGQAKTNIPELGNLKQSLSHFDMPMIPNLKELPKLDDTLGRITSLKDIELLGLGLPSMASASGKKYSHGVLYDPKFIKKLKRVSRFMGGLGGGYGNLKGLGNSLSNQRVGAYA